MAKEAPAQHSTFSSTAPAHADSHRSTPAMTDIETASHATMPHDFAHSMSDDSSDEDFMQMQPGSQQHGDASELSSTTPRKRKARRGPRRKRPVPREVKAYSEMSWEERKEHDERTALEATRTAEQLARLRDRGHGKGLRREQPPPAPVITNQFLVAQRLSPENIQAVNFPEPPIEEVAGEVQVSACDLPLESARSDFLEAYHESLYEECSREDLIAQLKAQDEELQRLREALRSLRESPSRSPPAASLSETSTKLSLPATTTVLTDALA